MRFIYPLLFVIALVVITLFNWSMISDMHDSIEYMNDHLVNSCDIVD